MSCFFCSFEEKKGTFGPLERKINYLITVMSGSEEIDAD